MGHVLFLLYDMNKLMNLFKKLYKGFRHLPKESQYAIVISTASIVVIVGLFFGYNKDLSGLLASVVGIAIGLLVTILFYKIQERDTNIQKEMIKRIDCYREEQQELRQSILRGPLSVITYELEGIRKDLSELEPSFSNPGEIKERIQNFVDSIDMQSQRVINYIPADIYFDIDDVAKRIASLKNKGIDEIITYLQKDQTLLNKKERLLKQIDYLIYNPLDEEKHSEMTFENIFNNNSESYKIVYGQLYDEIYGRDENADYKLAKKLEEKLLSKGTNCSVISDVMLKKLN
jgi:hypothetical protein